MKPVTLIMSCGITRTNANHIYSIADTLIKLIISYQSLLIIDSFSQTLKLRYNKLYSWIVFFCLLWIAIKPSSPLVPAKIVFKL